MDVNEARKELIESLDQSQWMVIKLFISVIDQAWGTLKGTLTDRQKELLEIISQSPEVKDTIRDMEKAISR